MERLENLLEPLPNRLRFALLWFAEKAGTEQPWPQPLELPEGETLLASKAKGIYKPAWSSYALSVRQSLGGQYPDRDPIIRPNGTWLYWYFQENEDPTARDDEYTNRGLMECWRDSVPVGVMRQTQAGPRPRYQILGLALVAGWDGGYFFLEGFAPDGQAYPRGPRGELEMLTLAQERQEETAASFNPTSTLDGRERTIGCKQQ